MKRDMDLIRELLLRLEGQDLAPNAVRVFVHNDERILIEGYGWDAIAHHLKLLQKAEMIESGGNQLYQGTAFSGLTWKGYDFLDSVRDPAIWARTKEGAKQAGGFTFDLLGALAKGFIKKQIEEKTGVEIDI